jgi:hypothetical protein
MDFLNGTMKVGASFQMDIHHHGSQSSRLLNIMLRMDYHQVDIERFLTQRCNSLENRKTKRDVGDENAIHHVKMQPIGFTAVNHADVTIKMQEVGG